jgi:hypothetical protein
VQGIWGYWPGPDDWPNYLCDGAKECMIITDLASARRFFQEKCRWRAQDVRHITAVEFLEGQTWRDRPPNVWPMRADLQALGDGKPEPSCLSTLPDIASR